MVKKFLDTQDIIKLDELIDSRISEFELLNHPKDVALFHIILAYNHFADKTDKIVPINSKPVATRNLYHGYHHSVYWIYDRCPPSRDDSHLDFDVNVFYQAIKMLTEAADYSVLWAQMILLHKNRVKARFVKTNHYQIIGNKNVNRELETARLVMKHAKTPLDFRETSIVSDSVVDLIQSKIKINKFHADTKLVYELAPFYFNLLVKDILRRNKTEWLMDPEWSMGSYTFKDLKIFWTVLQAVVVVHKLAAEICFKSGRCGNREFYNTRVKTNSKDRWIDELTLKTKLSRNVVESIMDDLIQNEKLFFRRGEKKTHTMYHPFYCFSDSLIGVCERTVLSACIERNTWTLLSILRPKISDKLKKEKESFWIKEIKEKVLSLGIKSFSNIEFGNKDKEGEIDLLLIDESVNFGLVCELKWLTSSDTASGVYNDDQQIIDGTSQAEEAVKWIDKNIDVFAQKINYDLVKLKNIEFKPIVISKESIGSGFLEKTETPIIDQNLFDWILFEPLKANIRTLWKTVSAQSYLPKANHHYVEDRQPFSWGELKFDAKDIFFRVKKRWTPENDIHLIED